MKTQQSNKPNIVDNHPFPDESEAEAKERIHRLMRNLVLSPLGQDPDRDEEIKSIWRTENCGREEVL